MGATITVRPILGLTRERLRRVLECSFALAATEGVDTDWPKLPPATMIKVHPGGGRFTVELRAAIGATAEQVLEAALIYKPHR